MTPVAAAGSTVLGIELISMSTPRQAPDAVALTGMHSPLVGLAGFLLIALALVLVAWSAKRSRP